MTYADSLRVKVSAVLILLLAAFAAIAPSAYAQVLYGSIVGTVLDASGSVVPGATTKIVNTSTGQSREVTSTETGTYSFADVLAGSYTVTISAQGFRAAQTTNVPVTINTVVRVDVQLQVGSLTDTVTVSAETATIQADKADLHVALGVAELSQLPLPAYRNFQSLLNLVPGAAPVAYQNAVAGSPGRSLVTNINGTVNSANNARLDGAQNMRASLPHQNLYIPPSESVETVNITTNSFDAEQGFAGGAAVSVVTKSGTNQFHGVVFEHHTDSGLKARYFFDGAKTAKNILNSYGGTIGGPVKKNKLFFFGGWEGMKERSNFTKITTVSTANQRAGVFTGLSTQLYDPLTGNADGTGRTLFANNVIPASRQSAPALKMQSLIPLPNLGSGTTANYFASAPVLFNRDNVDFKMNWNRSDKTSFWWKYSVMNALVTDEFSLGPAGGAGLANGGSAGTGDVRIQVAAIGGVHTFSPNFLVDGNVAVSRDPLTLIGPDSGTNYGLDVLKIPGTNGPDLRSSGLPMFVVSGYETFGNSETYMPKYVRNTYFTYSLNFGWTRDRHEMRFGTDVARLRVNEWHPEQGGGPRGQFTFDGSVTALRGGSSPNQFNNWAAFLLGLPQSMAKSVQPDDSAPRQWLEGYYFRDRWQASKNLTVTLGTRWEYYPVMSFAHYGMVRYDISSNQVYIGGRGSTPQNADVSASKKLFAPRIGLAYRLGQSGVVRAGYGISYDPQGPLSNMGIYAYPIMANHSFAGSNSSIPYGSLDSGIPAIVYPDLSSGKLPLPLTATTATLAQGLYARGYIQSFNFALERKLPGGFLGTAAYVGTRTVRQSINFNANAAPPGGGNPGRRLAASIGRVVDTTVFSPVASANYNALQAELNRQFSGGTLVKVSYTFSKAINLTDGTTGSLLFNYPDYVGRNRALAGYDRTSNLRVAWVASLPFGPGKRWGHGRVGGLILGGWQVNGIFSAYSGTPFTVSAAATSLNAPGNSQTADQVKSEVIRLGGVGAASPYFDPTAFAAVTQVRFGTSGRNILRGPGLVNLDGALFRNFNVTERTKFQFRFEAYNLSNTPHFNNPSSNVSTGGFLTITSAMSRSNNVEGGERQLRFALRISF
jgi:hypothetical protein